MSNIYITLEQNLTANEVIRKEPINFKGAPSVTFVLTGITEESNAALTLDVNYGDGTSNVFSQKDLVFNYKTNSIFNEMLYGKIFQPITLIRESYYDDIEKLGILNTQMVGLSTSNTVANLQSKFNKRSYITYLDNS